KSKQFEKGLTLLRQIEQEIPQVEGPTESLNGRVVLERSKLLLSSGDLKSAVEEAHRARDQYPDYHDTWSNLAKVLTDVAERQQNTPLAEAAIELARETVDRFPSNAYARNVWALALYAAGREEEARARAEDTKQQFPTVSSVMEAWKKVHNVSHLSPHKK